VTTVVVGAGHAGLAMSRHLAERSIDHVVLERGEVANSWRHERWDSLRLLTPNWQSRLPGYRYRGSDPDGYMSMAQVIDFVSGYASSISAPVETRTSVTSVRPEGDGYLVVTDRGEWRCETLVIASGAFNIPVVPKLHAAVPASIATLTPRSYRNPDDLEDGGVLVVGASATGLQLADEIHRSGRPVTLAVGEHVRMPRVYRGRDIQYWMDAAGLLDERYDEVDDIARARRVPSPQLVGTPLRATLDLNALTDRGVRLVGRICGIRDGVAQFSGSLRNVCHLADLKMHRLLDNTDAWAARTGEASELPAPERFEPTRVADTPCLGLDLGGGEVRTIVWATGFRPDYSWLHVPAFDRKGRLRHDGGVVEAPGMYVMGLPFLRRRKSSFIHGAEDDARELCADLAEYLDRVRNRIAVPMRARTSHGVPAARPRLDRSGAGALRKEVGIGADPYRPSP
jgi:putative flavoprotein involved in K+ transport